MKHFRMLTKPMLLAILLSAALVVSCSDDDDSGTNPTPTTADYFPYGYEFRWSYTSNFSAEKGTPVVEFEMKIDTATSWNGNINRGLFDYLMVRSAQYGNEWIGFLGVKDSGNVVYGLGDHPPEGPYPLFQHSYADGEATAETITVQGVTYDAMRVDVEFTPGVIISWWFAPNVGLIKEYSEQGGSIFTDDQWGKDVIMNTELVSYGII